MTNSKAAALLGVEEVADADLIPGAYEGRSRQEDWAWGSLEVEGTEPPGSDASARRAGGFKLWECALDLAQLVAQELCGAALPAGAGARLGGVHPAGAVGTLQNLRVLELGCGHGLPGIVSLLNGAEVHFQAGAPFRPARVFGLIRPARWPPADLLSRPCQRRTTTARSCGR